MKSFLFFLILVALAISLVVISFQGQIRAVALDVILQSGKLEINHPSATSTEGAPPPAEEPPEPKWVPEGFVGPPPGEPRIIGPRGNPPNY